MLNKILQGDCMDLLPLIPDHSVDMILCDLPYGITDCAWDKVLPMDALWGQYKRVITDHGAIVLTANQPFTSRLILRNPKMYRYCWYWKKNIAAGHLNAQLQPMRVIEDVLIFSRLAARYYPQGIYAVDHPRYRHAGRSEHYGAHDKSTERTICNYPQNWLEFPHDQNRIHPTQKPVALFEYLIRTYTMPEETVLDNCAGSFTTAVAADNTGRDWICMEREPKYCRLGRERINRNRAENLNASLFDDRKLEMLQPL